MKKAKQKTFNIGKYNKVVSWAKSRYFRPGMDYFYSYAVYKQIEYNAASRYLGI